MPTPNPNDLRVIKTKQNIRQSFLALLCEFEFHDIAVADILNKAQINRTTFYKHYANKNDLAKQLVDELIDDTLKPLLVEHFHQPLLDFLELIILNLESNYLDICALWKINTPTISPKTKIHQLLTKQYVLSYQNTADNYDDLLLQGQLYTSLILSFFELLINHDNICADTLLTNAKILSTRIL